MEPKVDVKPQDRLDGVDVQVIFEGNNHELDVFETYSTEKITEFNF